MRATVAKAGRGLPWQFRAGVDCGVCWNGGPEFVCQTTRALLLRGELSGIRGSLKPETAEGAGERQD